MSETFADYFTIPEVMELFNVENREALIVKGGVGDKYGLERVRFSPKLHLYRVADVVDHVTDKNVLETILARIQAKRGELVVGDWLPVRTVLTTLKFSREWLRQIKGRENGIQTIELDNATLYNRLDVERLARESQSNKVLSG